MAELDKAERAAAIDTAVHRWLSTAGLPVLTEAAVERAVAAGIAEVFGAWLAEHHAAVPEIVEAAVNRAFGSWVTTHAPETVTAISKAIQRAAAAKG